MPRSELVQAWIEESLKYPPKEPGGAGALRIVQYKDKYYFVDERCRQLRNVEDFMDQIKFATAGELLSSKLNDCQQITQSRFGKPSVTAILSRLHFSKRLIFL